MKEPELLEEVKALKDAVNIQTAELKAVRGYLNQQCDQIQSLYDLYLQKLDSEKESFDKHTSALKEHEKAQSAGRKILIILFGGIALAIISHALLTR